MAVFKSCSGTGGNGLENGVNKKVRVVQIWDAITGELEAELDVTKSHGDWYFDGKFELILVHILRS